MTDDNVKPTNPKFFRRNNLNLFSKDNKTFFCPICKKWKPINEFLNELFKENERGLYVALLVSEYKHFHMQMNIKQILKTNPELNTEINREAMNRIIDNDVVWSFLKKQGIGPDHFSKLAEADRAIKEKLLRRIGLRR